MPPEVHSSGDNSEFVSTQSIKTSLYLDNIDDFGEWPILLSAKAQKHLQEIYQADGAMFQVTVEKIGQLSRGQFTRSNHKLLTAPEMEVPVYGARMTGDRRMIYQIDCISDPRNSYEGCPPQEVQAIRVFGIFALAELRRSRFWNTLSRHSQQRGPEYIRRCNLQREPDLGSNALVLPDLFPPLPEQDEDTQETLPTSINEEEIKEIHRLLVLDKFTVLSQPVLNSIQTDKEVVHIPPLSTQEWEIVEHPTSCYVIGRSGTGKTTTMLLKMLGRHRNWEQFPDMGPKPRQVFITQSQVLATKVEGYFAKLMSTFKATTDPPEVHAMDEGTEQEAENFEEGLIGQEYNTRWRSGLPERFSQLVDDHFPLFITYSQLCAMLENDIELGRGNYIAPTTPTMDAFTDETTPPISPTSPWRTRQRAGSQLASSSDYMQQSRKNFISYNVFVSSYWDHSPQTATRKLDPVLVFGEFMGVIEGSENAVGTKDRCLDRESYTSLSARGQATFSHKRDEIYDLFEAYRKQKKRQGDYDAADRTHSILSVLYNQGFSGRKVDYLYVDEVQDHLIIDTRVLRMICANQHGLFWAGDTAQTISIGSSFRFADLKAYQYRIEKRLSYGLDLAPVEPRTFELVSNHRSHSGIVNCARSIVKLLIRYWPHSIDALRPEQATTPGFRPVFFPCHEDADLVKAFFTGGQGEDIDLGAKQCILVRNDVTKARLEEKFPILGRNNFMTLHESKGLEFNDVILYNFFKDSTATANQWRLILNDVPDEDFSQGAPTFDEARHGGLCVELKFLYVAITRARQNLWIVDSSESAEPMKKYWGSKEQITVWTSITDMPKLAVESDSLDDWSAAALTMFRNGNYAGAAIAYRRADQERKAKICDAYVLQEKAALTSTTANAARTHAFVAAAKAFVDCARNSPSKAERLTCYEATGDCYKEARDLKKAANNYRQGERYDKAALTYQEAGCVDEMVEMITQHKGTFTKSLHERLMKFAQMHYLKCLDTKAALKLFDSVEEALEFVEDWELDEARVKLLTELDRVLEAADIHAKKGKLFKAIETLNASATRSAEHVRRIIQYILAGLRRGFTFGVMLTPTSTSATLQKFLALADGLDESAKMEKGFDEVAMFQAIQRADYETLRTLAKVFIETRNDLAAVLSLDHVFSCAFELQGLTIFGAQEPLSLYLDYIRLLTKFLNDQSVSNNSNKRRLFGFQALGEGRWLVPQRTVLHEKLTGRFDLGGRKDEGYTCGYDELRRGIEAIIKNRILDRTMAQIRACREVHGFSPCLRLLIQGKCSPPAGRGPCLLQHVRPEQLTLDWYHARLRLILQQFRIIDTAGRSHFDPEYWIGRLYSILHPPFRSLGSFANLDVARIPEAGEGFRAVQRIIKDACHENADESAANASDRSRQLFVVACTLAFDLDRKNALSFVPRTSMFGSDQWPQSPFCDSENRRSIVQDFVGFLNGEAGLSLTYGLSYLSGVLDWGQRADANALCDLAERLSGLFIMAYRSTSEGVVHEVVLPRSWFIDLILPDTWLKQELPTTFELVTAVVELMRRIDMQVRQFLNLVPGANTEEQFTADGTRINGFTGPLYISRICLCLCLVGHNIEGPELREQILAGIWSLRRWDRHTTPRIYKNYADSKNWDDLENAFTESLKDSPFDELILLLHSSPPAPTRQMSKRIRTLTYTELEELPDLLSMASNPFRTRVASIQETGPQNGDGQGELSKSDHDEQVQKERLETEEIRADAAKTIQDAYRRYSKRKDIQEVVLKGVDAAQADHWRVLRQSSKGVDWSKNSQYYILFRVPLGSVLACLDIVVRFIHSEKGKANKKVKKARGDQLEASMKAFDQLSKLLKRTIAVQKELSPASTLHEKQSVSDLQHAVREVRAVVETLREVPGSQGTRDKIKGTWDRGSKWIFEKEWKQSKGEGAG